jgi:DNA repair protein RecO (recombination protein O)
MGIIIKRRDFNEADRLLTVYTKEFGKIQIKAQGVRRITSRRSSHIEQLNYTELSLYKGRSLHTLTEAQMVTTFPAIKGNLAKTGLAYHICELIDGLCPENQEQSQLFYLLKQTLDSLENASEGDMVSLIHDFEISLLTQLGYWHDQPEQSLTLDTHQFIENILERKLRSHRVFEELVHI